MPVKRNIPFTEGIFFITFTCHKWLNLIGEANGYQFVYSWYNHLHNNGHYVVGYVIMPNHVHSLIGFRNTGKSINFQVGEAKRFIGYNLLNELRELGKIALLDQLAADVNPKDKERGKKHEIWEDSFDWKYCDNEQLITQKLNYMHNNPCSKKWNLCESPHEYVHSSAKFYVTDEQGVFEVVSYGALEDIDLTKPF